MPTIDRHWTNLEKTGFRSLVLFVLLFMLTLSEHTTYLPSLRVWTDVYFEQAVRWTGNYLFQLPEGYTSQLSSDSTGALIHVFNISIIAILLGLSTFRIQFDYPKAWYWFSVVVSYYLALQLLLYGFNKVFKCQFFIPEPNTLYTTVGETPRDLLFWSVMGSAYGYTVFGGVLEVIAGCLLLLKRTRLLGALMAFGILANVVAINFGFNISVKLYSSFYCFLAGLLITAQAKRLYAFFIQNKHISNSLWFPTYTPSQQKIYASTKIFIVWLLFFEALAPYFTNHNFNDDTQTRPAFHGAYTVQSFIQNNIPFPPVEGYAFRWKRAFVHRRGYFIVQTMDDNMQDYHFEYDRQAQLFRLTHPISQEEYWLDYSQPNAQTLLLKGEIDEQEVQIRLSSLNWKQLPLLQQEFHWTIDGLKQG